MFKIIVILLLLLMVGGAITRRMIRIVALAVLIVLLIREIGRLDVSHISFTSCKTGSCCQSLPFCESHEQDIPIAAGSAITLTSVLGGKVKIHGWDKPFVRIKTNKHAGTKKDLERLEAGIKTDASKGDLSRSVDITGGAEGSTWSAGDGWFSVTWSRSSWSGATPCIDYDLFIPKEKLKTISVRVNSAIVDVRSIVVAEALNIHVRSGEILAENILGDIDIRSHSGQVKLSDIQGAVKVDSRSGFVSANNLSSDATIRSWSGAIQMSQVGGTVSAHTRSGAVNIDGVRGDVDVQTRSGSISLNNISGSVAALARSGSISITRASSARGTVKASSRSGQIVVKDSKGNVLAQGRGQVTLR